MAENGVELNNPFFSLDELIFFTVNQQISSNNDLGSAVIVSSK